MFQKTSITFFGMCIGFLCSKNVRGTKAYGVHMFETFLEIGNSSCTRNRHWK